MTQLFANNAYGSLAAEASAVTTTLTLGAGQGLRFPSPTEGDFFLLTLVGLDDNGNEASWEIVKVTARASDTLTVVRAQESTTAVLWPVGTRAELRVTSGTLLSFTDATEAAAAAPVQSVAGRTGAVVLSKSDVGLGNVENKSSATIRSELTSGNVTTALGFTPENAANKGAANGYVPLGSDSKIASSYLPSYVDDVLEYANLAALPGTGVVGIIYVTLDTNKVYRWSGSGYTEISASPGSTDAVPEGSVNLYFTNARAQAALSGMYLPSTGGMLTGNLAFNGSSLRITGDFTSATRVMVQTNTANSPTYFGVLPNGTSVNAQLHVYGASDITNAPYGTLTINSASVRLQSTAAGSGTALPLTFLVGSTEVARASTSHNFLIGTATDDGTHKLQVAGAIGVQGADAAVLTRLRATTGMVRVRPYLDATSGGMIDSTNAAENAYLPLTLQGSSVRLLGSSGTGLTVDSSGVVTATTFIGSLSGNATTATRLQSARTINGTSFDGSANITTTNWGTARTLWGQSINGSSNITGPLLPAAGSATGPAFSTSDDTNTGMFFPAADTIAFAEGGLSLGNLNTYFRGLFAKADSTIVAFTKTGVGTATTSSTLYVEINGAIKTIASGASIAMPTLTAGTDYAIWAKPDGTLEATSNHTSPPVANARKIGGFHYAPGGNATAQSGGNTTPQINEYSFWDLKFRPACSDPRGMTLVAGCFWVDIYLTGVDAITNGSSKYNVTMADGSSPPKVPTLFGGNGSTTYGSYTWFEAMELSAAFGKRCPTQREFMAAMYGTTEASSIGTDQGSTILNAAYTSKWGVVQSTGVLWIWGDDRGGAYNTAGWNANTEGRGSEYNATNAVLLGGGWGDGSYSGSRCSLWDFAASFSGTDVGSRFCCDHLQLD